MPKANSANKKKSPPKKNQLRRTPGERAKVSPSDKIVSQGVERRAKGMVPRSPRRDKGQGTYSAAGRRQG